MPTCSSFPCIVCKFNVHSTYLAIFCDICHNWTDLKCVQLCFTRLEYNAMSELNDDWYRSTWLHEFFHSTILTMTLISSLHCTASILKVILIQIYLNRRILTPFLMTLRCLICYWILILSLTLILFSANS